MWRNIKEYIYIYCEEEEKKRANNIQNKGKTRDKTDNFGDCVTVFACVCVLTQLKEENSSALVQ